MQKHVTSFSIDAILSDTRYKTGQNLDPTQIQRSSPATHPTNFPLTRTFPILSPYASPGEYFPHPVRSHGGNLTLPIGGNPTLTPFAPSQLSQLPWLQQWPGISANETYYRWLRRNSMERQWPVPYQWPNNTSRSGRNNRMRKGGQVRFTAHQTQVLENAFATQRYLTSPQRQRMSSQLNLSERQVKTWFQNRRAKWRRLREGRLDGNDSDHQSQSDGDGDEIDILDPTISEPNPC